MAPDGARYYCGSSEYVATQRSFRRTFGNVLDQRRQSLTNRGLDVRLVNNAVAADAISSNRDLHTCGLDDVGGGELEDSSQLRIRPAGSARCDGAVDPAHGLSIETSSHRPIEQILKGAGRGSAELRCGE